VTVPTSIAVQSTEFADDGPIPTRYTCDGENTSPPLSWAGIPPNTAALALVVDDPDAPRGTYTHWVVVIIDPAITSLSAGSRFMHCRIYQR
jgi:Raf kinase inhibitor-like YbhB/YbcL family protein